MADYCTVVSDAVSGLPSKTYEARRALYERARTALRETLRNHDPPLSETELANEQSAFESAISKVETESLFREMRADREEYAALSAQRRFIVTAKQFECSVRDNFNDTMRIIRDRLRSNETTLARPDQIISRKYQANRVGRMLPVKVVPTKADIAAFVQWTQLKANNIGRRIRLNIFGKRF